MTTSKKNGRSGTFVHELPNDEAAIALAQEIAARLGREVRIINESGDEVYVDKDARLH